jgi:hypothetical protein
VTSHRSCNRSIPVERRNRRTNATREEMMPTGRRAIGARRTGRIGRSASTPSGFCRFGMSLPSISPGPKRIARKISTSVTPSARANHRHRADGRCPVGKISSRKVAGRATMGTHRG